MIFHSINAYIMIVYLHMITVLHSWSKLPKGGRLKSAILITSYKGYILSLCLITIEVNLDHLASNIVYLFFFHHEVKSFLFPLPCSTLEGGHCTQDTF